MNFSTTINLFPKTLSKKIKSRQRRVVGLLLNKTAKYCNEDFMAKVNKSHVWPDSQKIKLCNLLNFKMSFGKDDPVWNWLMLTCRRIFILFIGFSVRVKYGSIQSLKGRNRGIFHHLPKWSTVGRKNPFIRFFL